MRERDIHRISEAKLNLEKLGENIDMLLLRVKNNGFKKENKPENPWLNLGFNIILPSFLLIKGGKLFESLGITGENVDAQVFVLRWRFRLPTAFGTWRAGANSIFFRLSEC